MNREGLWRDKAPCPRVGFTLFEPLDVYNDEVWEALGHAAQTFCAGCPVQKECGAFGDLHQHIGTWGGVHRRRERGRYKWRVLVDGAAKPELRDRRRSSVHNGRAA